MKHQTGQFIPSCSKRGPNSKFFEAKASDVIHRSIESDCGQKQSNEPYPKHGDRDVMVDNREWAQKITEQFYLCQCATIVHASNRIAQEGNNRLGIALGSNQ